MMYDYFSRDHRAKQQHRGYSNFFFLSGLLRARRECWETEVVSAFGQFSLVCAGSIRQNRYKLLCFVFCPFPWDVHTDPTTTTPE